MIAFNATVFFVYYTFYQANKQAYLDKYYPPPSPEDFISVSIPTSTNIVNDQDQKDDSCDVKFQKTEHETLLKESKYPVDLNNDPSKYLLLSSLFKTMQNTEICKYFASKQKKHPNLQRNQEFASLNRILYVLVYNDGGYSYNFIDKVLSNVFDEHYRIVNVEEMKKSGIGDNDKLILLIRDPFDAISMHLRLYELMKSSEIESSKALETLSNYWCDMEMFDRFNIKNEAKKWKNIVEHVLNDYLPQFGDGNLLVLQMEDLMLGSKKEEDEILVVTEQYLKIANFLFDEDESKINENKFAWITKIICELEANEQLLKTINMPTANERNAHDCKIWAVVQNYASLYQYFPSTYDCI